MRHRNIAEFACSELDKLDPVQPEPPVGVIDEATLNDYVEKQKLFGEMVQRQASLLHLLVTESAFMA